MIKTILGVSAFILVFNSQTSLADDHLFTGGMDPAAPFNVQVNVCSLNEGKSLAQYNRMNEKYFAWAKANGVETTFVRHTPLFSHANGNNPLGFDFLDLLGSDYETSGKAWDLWLGSSEGQKLNSEWQELGSCNVKMATVAMQWGDVNALNEDDDRIVTWNWCTRKDGVSTEQVMAKHQAIAKEYSDGIGNIGWFTFVPLIGGANSSGDFAHIVVYPDAQGLMQHQKWYSEGGWKMRQDYYTYVDCNGDAAMTETVMHRPGD